MPLKLAKHFMQYSCSVNQINIIQFGTCLFVINQYIFCHLQLKIGLASNATKNQQDQGENCVICTEDNF